MSTRDSARKGSSTPGNQRAQATLALRPDLPPRVRTLLVELLAQMRAYFMSALSKTLEEIEDTLFTLAERAGSNTLQQQRFEALREIKRRRDEISPRFLAHLEVGLARVRIAGSARSEQPTFVAGPERSPLELLDAEVLDEKLALREIASKSEIRHSLALYALSRRFAVVAGTPIGPSDELPLGPARIMEAFRHSLELHVLDAEARVLAYREFDRVAMQPIGPLYAALNAYLVEQRVLANLRGPSHTTYRQPSPAKDKKPAHSRAPERDPSSPSPSAPPPPMQSPGPETTAEPTHTHMHARQMDSPGSRAAPAPHAHARQPRQEDATEAALFGTLRRLLSERRQEVGGSRRSPIAGSYAASDEVQSVLGAMQHKPPGDGMRSLLDSEHLKNTLMVKLRRTSPGGRPRELAEEDGDTIDLVGMLFDYISEHVASQSSARALLSRLHIPVLRVALNDKSFFTRHDHPARELLNTLAETGTQWVDEAEADPELAQKMQLVVDRVTADFDGDIGVFETLLRDLNEHMQTLARRAEMVERRQIEAAKGRDKLDLARQTAREAIDNVVKTGAPVAVVRTLLEQAWTDAMALSLLRRGADSSEYRRRLAIAENLARVSGKPSTQPVDQDLRGDLDTGLRQIGLHDNEISSILEGVVPAPDVSPATAQEALRRVDSALSRTTRLGDDRTDKPAKKGRLVPEVPLNAEEKEALERLRKIPFGTWFDFVINQQGECIRRKLAWYSTLTGRCLFVNQRGAQAGDKTLEILAREVARDQARPILDKPASLIDRAWKAIMETLRARSPTPKPAT